MSSIGATTIDGDVPLTVRGDSDETEPPTLKRVEPGPSRFEVVVGIDFTPESEHALEVACGMAQISGLSVVHAVHSVLQPHHPFVIDMAGHIDLTEARDRLEGLCQRFREAFGTSIVPHVLVGDPEHSVITVARDREADLVVVGFHPRGRFARRFRGSTSEKVMREAPCAVLVTRHPSYGEGRAAS